MPLVPTVQPANHRRVPMQPPPQLLVLSRSTPAPDKPAALWPPPTAAVVPPATTLYCPPYATRRPLLTAGQNLPSSFYLDLLRFGALGYLWTKLSSPKSVGRRSGSTSRHAPASSPLREISGTPAGPSHLGCQLAEDLLGITLTGRTLPRYAPTLLHR